VALWSATDILTTTIDTLTEDLRVASWRRTRFGTVRSEDHGVDSARAGEPSWSDAGHRPGPGRRCVWPAPAGSSNRDRARRQGRNDREDEGGGV